MLLQWQNSCEHWTATSSSVKDARLATKRQHIEKNTCCVARFFRKLRLLSHYASQYFYPFSLYMCARKKARFFRKLRLLSHYASQYFYPFSLYMCARKKAGDQEEEKELVYISLIRGATCSGRIWTKLGKCVYLTDVIKRAMKWFPICEVWMYPYCHSNPRLICATAQQVIII